MADYDDGNAGAERRERAVLKARGAHDALAHRLWRVRRELAQVVDDSKRLPDVSCHAPELVRVQAALVTVEISVLEKSEIRGEQAAKKLPKAEPKPLRQVAWCSCALFPDTPHLHRDKHPDEVPP